MTYGSLFSGIGGLDLALEHFGHTPLWQAEKDPYARRVLARHWPNIRCFEDVKEINGDAPPPDIICGGFPCQDISNAGKRVGIDGERSGLWTEFARIVRELRPRVVLVENVAALSVRGLDRVLGDLAALGFDAEWDVLRASDVGALHLRARIFILAYAERDALRLESGWLVGTGGADEAEPRSDGDDGTLADSICAVSDGGREVSGVCRASEGAHRRGMYEPGGCGEDVSYSDSGGCQGERRTERVGSEAGFANACGDQSDRRDRTSNVADAGSSRRRSEARDAVEGKRAEATRPGQVQPGGRRGGLQRCGYWDAEPDVGRVVARIPPGVDGRGTGIGRGSRGVGGGRDRANRLRCLGNAVVWQQAAFAIEVLTARALA